MGNCFSAETRLRRRRNNRDGRPRGSERTWSDRGPDDSDRRVLPSMLRVGSRVFRASVMEMDVRAAGVKEDEEDGDGEDDEDETKPTVHKASTYEHVHEMVEMGIEAKNNGGDDMSGSRALSGRVGLTNLGNTCFMNSSLQCLSNTIPLTDYFLGYDFRGEINHDNFLGTKGQLVSSYAELTKHLWLGSDPSFRPTGFKSDLARFAPQFEGNEQHDAQELLAFLLDGIHEDLNRVRERPYIEEEDCDGTNDEDDAITAWSHYLQRNRSITVDLFQGQLRNTMTCQRVQPDGARGCGHVNVKFDPFMYLSLPISDKCDTLDDCLDIFCEEELLAGDNQWYCKGCETHVDATKKIDLFMLPPIMIIHLKRFKFSETGQKSKIDRFIRYPLDDWDLSKMKKSAGGTYPLYDLYATSHHRGNVGFGHYTAQAKNRFDGEWYDFNDSRCERVDSAELSPGGCGSSAYCLFYNRAERVPARAGGDGAEKKTVVRRQSVSRPELWPHLQRAKASEWKSVRLSGRAQDGGEDWDGSNDPGLTKISE